MREMLKVLKQYNEDLIIARNNIINEKVGIGTGVISIISLLTSI